MKWTLVRKQLPAGPDVNGQSAFFGDTILFWRDARRQVPGVLINVNGGRIYFCHLPAWANRPQREFRGDGGDGQGPDERDPRHSPGSARRALGVRRGAAFSDQRSAFRRRHAEPEEGCRVCSPTTRWSRGGREQGRRHGTATWCVLFGANASTPCDRVAGAPSKFFVVVQVRRRVRLHREISAPGRARDRESAQGHVNSNG